MPSNILTEYVYEPYSRLKWGIPSKRHVDDWHDSLAETNNVEAEEGSDSYNKTGPGEKPGREVELMETTNAYPEAQKRHRWWHFFDENEYRPKRNQISSRKWWHWYGDIPPEEKKLLMKLDVLVTAYAFIAFWIEYLDSWNINHAYISGMREDIGMKGNDLVNTQRVYNIGVVVFQIPYCFVLHLVPLNFVLPGCNFIWSLLTLATAFVKDVKQLKTVRFFIGMFEAPVFLSYQYMFGNFYKHDEIVRRAAVFHIGSFVGMISAGLIQSNVYAQMHDLRGWAGWRWNFVIDCVISIAVATLGLYVLPGDPFRCYSLFLTDDEIRLARKRSIEAKIASGEQNTTILDLKTWKRCFSDWKVYLLIIWNILGSNNNNGGSGAYLLWLESLNRFSIPKMNDLGMITPGLGVIYALITAFIADNLHTKFGAILFSQTFNILGNIILAVWNVPEGAKWFAFMLQFFGAVVNAPLFSWVNDIYRRDAQMRGIVMILIGMMGHISATIISPLVWPTVEAPRFLKGYTFAATASTTFVLLTLVVLYAFKRQEKAHYEKERRGEDVDSKEIPFLYKDGA